MGDTGEANGDRSMEAQSAEVRAVGTFGQHGQAARPGGFRCKAQTSAMFNFCIRINSGQSFS